MAKPAERRDYVYNYILEHLRTIYEKLQSNKITRKEHKRYPNVTALINMVFDDEQFIDTASPHFEFRQPTQICISRNTVRKAINQLIADNKIRLSNGSYEYVPHLESALKEHPILPVAQQVAITIGVPESILVLTISNGFAQSVAEYLSSQFYKGDIIFIPIGNHIICIGVCPKSALQNAANTPESESKLNNSLLRMRIELVLHQFTLNYPDFQDGDLYEYGYLLSHNQQVINSFKDLIHNHIQNQCSNTETEIFQIAQDSLLSDSTNTYETD